MKKKLKAILLICLLLTMAFSAGCAGKFEHATEPEEKTTWQKGDNSVSLTG